MNKHQSDSELEAYFREAGSWADDRMAQNARSRRVAWIIAGVATTIAALEAIALAGLAPLKTVVPMTVLVDRQTGHVTTLDPSQPVKLAPAAALAKSMLAQYVTARESLDRATIAVDYRKVALWSGEAARSSYFDQMKPGNPDSPLVRLQPQSSLRARIKSVSLIDDAQALVRYDLVQQNAAGAESAPAAWVAVIRYRFRDRPLAEADRFINPLGFEVTRYRTDPEAAPATSVEQPVPAQQAVPLPAPGDQP
jgi:type IV secretion system protein VirB8